MQTEDEYIDTTKILTFDEEALAKIKRYKILAERLSNGKYPFDDGIRGHLFYPLIKIKEKGRYTSFLDCGTGVGSTVRQLILAGMKKENVIGIDIRPKHIEYGFQLYRDKDEMKNNFVIGDVRCLSKYFNPERFDYVYSSFLLHLLKTREDVEKFFLEANKVLRNKGIFFGRTRENSNTYSLTEDELTKSLYKVGFEKIFTKSYEQDGINILQFCYQKL